MASGGLITAIIGALPLPNRSILAASYSPDRIRQARVLIIAATAGRARKPGRAEERAGGEKGKESKRERERRLDRRTAVDGQSLLPRKASECPPRDSASMGQPKNDRANRSTIVIAFLHGHCPALGPLIYGEQRTQGPAPSLSLSSAGRSIDRLVISFGDESVGLFSLVVESEQWPPRVAGRQRRVAWPTGVSEWAWARER